MAETHAVDWIWRQIGLTLPADWECLQFSREWQAGRCAFADAYRYRFELNWRIYKSEPDFDRMLKEYAGSLESNWRDVRPVNSAGWRGLAGRRGDEAVTRYGRYLAPIGVLVEVVFIAEQRRDESLEHRVLRTIEAVPPQADGLQRWRAFGLDVQVPAAFRLEECVVQPARIGLRFISGRAPDRWIFRRYGMVDAWLDQPVDRWLAAQTEAGVKEERPGRTSRDGYTVYRLQGRWRPRGLLKAGGAFAASAWRDPRDQRLYQAICVTGRRHAALHPAGGADERARSAPEFLCIPEGG
jgi:hypothetical protein